MNKIIGVLFIFFVVVCTFSCLGKVEADTVFADPTDFTNLVISCDNDHIIFDTSDIIFSNTTFVFKGNCTVTSNVEILDFKITTLSTNDSITINKLTLESIGLSVNSIGSILNDVIIKMDNQSSFIVSTIVEIDYSGIIPPNEEIFSGGLVTILSASTLRLTSTYPTVHSSSSEFSNSATFEVNSIRFGFNINNYQALIYSNNYFNEGIFSTADSNGILSFVQCRVQIGKYINLNGGVLSLDQSELYTRNLAQYSYYYNTTIELSNNTKIILYRYNENLNLITGIKLQDGSKLRLLNGTASVSFQIFSLVQIYTNPGSETFIFSDQSSVDCNNYITTNNSLSFKLATNPNRDIRLSGYTICSKRNIVAVIYNSAQFAGNIDVNGCPEDQYACIGSAQCIPINQTCENVACASSLLQLRDYEQINIENNVASTYASTEDVPKCWNGECAPFGYAECSTPYPSCQPNTPLRCAGKCVAANETCGDESACVAKCVDGCYNVTRDCQPFNGCPLYHFQCPNNDCVKDKSLCSTGTNSYLPFSNRFLRLQSKVYADVSDVSTMIFREGDGEILHSTSEVSLISPNVSTSPNTNSIKISPISDSHGLSISGANIKPNFNYYTDLLSAPFTITLNSENSTTFEQPAQFFFSVPQIQDLTTLPGLCLAFENTKGEWECTPYEPVFTEDKSGVFLKTSHFTNFALLISYKQSEGSNSTSSEPSNSVFSDKKTLAIAISLSVVGAVLIVVAVGLLINFKLKYTSLRRWRVSRDLEREQNRSRLTSSSSSLNTSTSSFI